MFIRISAAARRPKRSSGARRLLTACWNSSRTVWATRSTKRPTLRRRDRIAGQERHDIVEGGASVFKGVWLLAFRRQAGAAGAAAGRDAAARLRTRRFRRWPRQLETSGGVKDAAALIAARRKAGPGVRSQSRVSSRTLVGPSPNKPMTTPGTAIMRPIDRGESELLSDRSGNEKFGFVGT